MAKSADPRATRFPLMEHPMFTFGMVAIYLSWVLVIGPLFMRDRKPFQLRRTLVVYNASRWPSVAICSMR